MKKINLKSILKKTFKKKAQKKVKTKKKVAKKPNKSPEFKKKQVGRKKEKKLVLKKESKTKVQIENSNQNLRISKSTIEQKPEIKKIKKQSTEKKLFKIKDYVVYPKHGVGQITEFKKISIGGIDVETYILSFEKDKANGMIPVNKQSHLRPLATINQVNKCISILKGKPKIKRSMWSRRAQEYEAKISSGKIYELAEVVRDLNKGDDLMVDQSYSERQLFEKAYERILSEFQIILNISQEDTQKKLDKALKRNIENQQTLATQTSKGSTNNLPEFEQAGPQFIPIRQKYSDEELIELALLNPGYGFKRFVQLLSISEPFVLELFTQWKEHFGEDIFGLIQDESYTQMVSQKEYKKITGLSRVPRGSGRAEGGRSSKVSEGFGKGVPPEY